MSACGEFASLVEARLTDSLGADAVRLEEHLATCSGCRPEVSAQEELLGLARLPAASVEELRALEGLPLLTWKALRQARVRRLSLWGGGVGLGIAAALAFVIAVPHGRGSAVVHPRPADVEESALASGDTELDFGTADDTDDGADDTVDLEDFASLDVSPSTATSADDDDDEDGTSFQGEAL